MPSKYPDSKGKVAAVVIINLALTGYIADFVHQIITDIHQL